MIDIKKLKELRKLTTAPLLKCKEALKESGGDLKKAIEILEKEGERICQEKEGRKTKAGVIASYIHVNRKIGVLLELKCETDFVASLKEFSQLAHEICLQIAATNPKYISLKEISKEKEKELVLLEQNWIKDESKKIKDLINSAVLKLKEKIVISRFIRYEI